MTYQATKLEPCPFCGGTAFPGSEDDDDGIKWHYIKCMRCAARTRGRWHSPGNDCPELRAEVRDEWNQRAALPPQAKAEPAGVSENHPCRFFNGKCIDCGRSYGAPRAAGVMGDQHGK